MISMGDDRASEALQLPAHSDAPIGSSRRQLSRLFDDLLSREEHAVFVRSLRGDPELGTT